MVWNSLSEVPFNCVNDEVAVTVLKYVRTYNKTNVLWVLHLTVLTIKVQSHCIYVKTEAWEWWQTASCLIMLNLPSESTIRMYYSQVCLHPMQVKGQLTFLKALIISARNLLCEAKMYNALVTRLRLVYAECSEWASFSNSLLFCWMH